ncbi:MAG: hypothetical protein EOO10_23290 [Chitinophagaceae bacterium]|nr:MAG: hypothetical protein EOO10_23290 [Chitinophagaceae bacterium]
MNTVPNRVVVYPKDVANITGLRPRAARKLLSLIRQKLQKDRSAFITVRDFAGVTGISEDIVQTFLR